MIVTKKLSPNSYEFMGYEMGVPKTRGRGAGCGVRTADCGVKNTEKIKITTKETKKYKNTIVNKCTSK